MAQLSDTPILDYQWPYVPPSAGAGFPQSGSEYYWPSITRLTGGVLATDLDAQPIHLLADRSLLEVVIAGRGESLWMKVTDNTTPGTDTEAGRIQPTEYNASTSPYILLRQAGY
jgi:hypothetical protein